MNTSSINQLASMLGQGMSSLQGATTNTQNSNPLASITGTGSSALQQNTTDQINQLIQQANASISCGPTCQQQKNVANLQQIYLNAQENILSAPDQLKTAEKNYYVATKGEGFYHQFLKKELTVKSSALGDILTNTFHSEISTNTELAQVYNGLLRNYNHVLELYNNYVEKNATLEKDIKQTNTDIVTNDRKTYYEVQNTTNMQGWYHFFMWIYIILLFVFIIAMFAVPSTSYSIYAKVVILAFFFLYPFLIDRVVMGVLAFFHSLYELLPKNIYTTL